MRRIHSCLKFLSPDEIEEIHKTSLRILEEIGFYVPHEKVLGIIQENGGEVDFETKFVRIPQGVMEDRLKRITKSFDIIPAYFENNFHVGDGTLKLWMNFTQDMCDWKTYERKLCSSKEMLSGIILGNELPFVGNNAIVATPKAISPVIVDVYSWHTLYSYSKKACNSWIYSPKSAKYILDFAITVSGSEDNLRKKKNLMYFAESISPLKWARDTLEIMLMYSTYEVPIFLGPIVSTGGSGPVTLAGSLALANAEILSGIFILSALNINQPIIYPCLTTPLNMRTAMISFGAPEMALLSAASVQMGSYYGLPSSGNVHLSDSNMPDFQYGYEKAATFSFALAAGIEMWGIIGYSAAGHMGTNPGLSSLEGIVLDNECFTYMDRILRGLEINKDTLALDVIKEVGIGGSFLQHEHTLKHFRNELWDSELFVRQSYSDWLQKGKNNIVNNIITKTDDIIHNNWPCELAVDKSVKRELDIIYRNAKKDILNNV
jgi:trimethylamine--corrinoid protein Co-methyltransferase